ncbi:hypothetical protein IFM46972_03710 [Aspergillus udagawae]|uniref:Eukaryotic translation initiation factor 5A n=1 Tax=Aspergillus udagawae TaxID=91492 RepID=A0A8H3NFG4_9EURO|nr:hypothetical protein IFM46972_03710 [Aspergillus udagawae]
MSTFPILASNLRQNGYVVIHNRPCKIIQNSASRNKCHIVARDIFTGDKLEATVAQDASMDVPQILRTEYDFSYTDDGMLYLIDSDGGEKNDVRLPSGELGDRINDYEQTGTTVIITVISAMGEEAAIAVREKAQEAISDSEFS